LQSLNLRSLVEERASGLCEKYNNEIKNLHNNDAKLELIITTIYALEHLHPFNDGNTRTFSIALLLRLLLQNGFIPPTQFNPNFIEGMSVKEFISEMRQAMGVTENLVNGSKVCVGWFDQYTRKSIMIDFKKITPGDFII
jgi:Fic family protein